MPLEKQFKMMHVILHLYHRAKEVIARPIPISKLLATGLFDKLVKMKYDVPNDNIAKLDTYYHDIDEAINSVA